MFHLADRKFRRCRLFRGLVARGEAVKGEGVGMGEPEKLIRITYFARMLIGNRMHLRFFSLSSNFANGNLKL